MSRRARERQRRPLPDRHTSWESLKRYTHIQPKHVLEKLGSASKKSRS